MECGDQPGKTCVKAATLVLKTSPSVQTTFKLEQKGVVSVDGATIELPYEHGTLMNTMY